MLAPYRVSGTPGSAGFRAAKAPSEDPAIRKYFDRLMRLIPAEIVAVYPPIASTIPKGSWAIFVWPFVAIVLLIVNRAVFSRDPDRNVGPDWRAVTVSAISFLIWVYTLDGILVESVFGAYYPHWGLILVVAWTYLTPLLFRSNQQLALAATATESLGRGEDLDDGD
ncbi:MAG: hypothetical protein RIC55_09410 [Pirellulaceae bacterium]